MVVRGTRRARSCELRGVSSGLVSLEGLGRDLCGGKAGGRPWRRGSVDDARVETILVLAISGRWRREEQNIVIDGEGGLGVRVERKVAERWKVMSALQHGAYIGGGISA